MGYHSLVTISHDNFDKLESDPGFMAFLRRYINSGGKEEAQRLADYTHDAIQVVAMRHSSDNFYISNTTVGFPAKLPYDEQLDEENKAWEAAATKARAWLGRSLKLRTMAEVRNLVIRLIQKHKVADSQIMAGDGAFFGRRKLENTSWTPTRADYEALVCRLEQIDEKLSEPA